MSSHMTRRCASSLVKKLWMSLPVKNEEAQDEFICEEVLSELACEEALEDLVCEKALSTKQNKTIVVYI